MLNQFKTYKHARYGFSFQGLHQESIAGIYSIGWENRKDTSYDWDGLNRIERGAIVFQYTLKGEGEIRIKNKKSRLKPGTAFFIDIPSDHRYRLPKDSEEWDFIYITLSGKESMRCYKKVVDDHGHILELDLHSPPIKHIVNLLEKVRNKEIDNSYESSSEAYQFLMRLKQFLYIQKNNREIPDPVKKALFYMERKYANPALSLDDIIASSGVSKYHFIRIFKEAMLSTPIQYLTKVRIDQSIELLRDERLTIEEIALKVGFSNGNYFNKVFRTHTGLSAGRYRDNKLFYDVDHLFTD